MKKIIALALALVMVMAMAAIAPSAKADATYTVGVCQLVPHPALDAATQGFQDKLEELLGAENVKVVVKVGAGDTATCLPIVNDFVVDQVDLIMANATPALQAAAQATADIPILGTSVTEYGVAMGIEDFDGTVGGNVSGTSDLAPLDEQAALFQKWCPEAKTVGLLYCSAEANSQYQVDTVQKYLEEMGYVCTQYPFLDLTDMPNVAQEAASKCDAIYVPTDNTVASAASIVDGICQPAGIPVIAGEEGICAGCGIATLSISYYDLGVKTAIMAAQILKGEANISEMPISYADTVTPKYNAATCEALGITPVEGFEAIG